MLRFSNENSYLNWARNGVLSSGVGVAMYAQEHHRGAQLSGAGENCFQSLMGVFQAADLWHPRTFAVGLWLHRRWDCEVRVLHPSLPPCHGVVLGERHRYDLPRFRRADDLAHSHGLVPGSCYLHPSVYGLVSLTMLFTASPLYRRVCRWSWMRSC